MFEAYLDGEKVGEEYLTPYINDYESGIQVLTFPMEESLKEAKEYTMSVLEIKNLHVSVEDKEILKGLNLTLKTGEIAAIMGLTELVNLPLSCYHGNPNYEITEGDILLMAKASLIWKLTNVHA